MGEFGQEFETSEAGKEQTQESQREINDGIVEFLEDYGFEGGKVPLRVEEEGKEVEKEIPFQELTPVQKYNIINNIAESKAEGKYELTEAEIEAINVLREKQTNLEDYLNERVSSEIDKVEQHYQVQTTDYKDMDPDLLYTSYLKDKYPDKSDDEIKTELEVAKDLEGYEDKVKAIRNVFLEKEDLERQSYEKEQRKKFEEELEKQRDFVVNSTFDTKTIAGWNVTEEDLNKVYEDLLETDEEGISKFQKDVFGDPKNMVKAAYLYKNAENLFNRMEMYYKSELKKAKAEAKKEVFSGSDIDKSRATYIAENKDEKKQDKKAFSSWEDE